MTEVENKILDVKYLILDIEKKVTDHDHDKYSTTSEFSELTTENFTARLAQENLVTKADFDAKLMSRNKKINSKNKKTKPLLVENELKKTKTFDLS